MSGENRGHTIAAFTLIALGVIFLLGQFGFNLRFNWWAIFIALPGAAMLWNVYQAYSRRSRLDSNEMIQGFIGVFLILIAGGFLFDIELDWLWNLWPLILIGIGLALLFGYGQRGGEKGKRDEL